MKVDIRFVGGVVAGTQRSVVEEIVVGALARFQHRLKQVSVYVQDVNGPRGGVDKQCRCILHVTRKPPIVISDADESFAALLHRVADRAAFALSRQTDKWATAGVGKRLERHDE